MNIIPLLKKLIEDWRDKADATGELEAEGAYLGCVMDVEPIIEGMEAEVNSWEERTCAECGYCLGIETTETGTTKKPGYPTPVTLIYMDFDCIKYDRQWRETKQIGEHADKETATEPRKACPSLKLRKVPEVDHGK